jgi:hypothetical protein
MFRFTIRDVLWLMVVAGLGLGWIAAAHRLSIERDSRNHFESLDAIQHNFIEHVADAHRKASESRKALGDQATQEEDLLSNPIAWRVWGLDLARNHVAQQEKNHPNLDDLN